MHGNTAGFQFNSLTTSKHTYTHMICRGKGRGLGSGMVGEGGGRALTGSGAHSSTLHPQIDPIQGSYNPFVIAFMAWHPKKRQEVVLRHLVHFHQPLAFTGILAKITGLESGRDICLQDVFVPGAAHVRGALEKHIRFARQHLKQSKRASRGSASLPPLGALSLWQFPGWVTAR
eukprot:scaffold52689_cov16-Tisochrysis_lutea.AAC.1